MIPCAHLALLLGLVVLFALGCPSDDDDTAGDDDTTGSADDDDAIGDDDDTADDDAADDDTADDDTADDDTGDDDTVVVAGELSVVADFRIEGEDVMDFAGYWISTSGDLNGDGIDDVAVAAPEEQGDFHGGLVYVLFGRASSWPADFQGADVRMTGDATVEYLGNLTLSIVDDLNGDGLDDLVVGDEYYHDGSQYGGRALVYYGRASGWPTELADADVVIGGTEIQGYLGETVSGAGDVDGDGRGDLLLAAPNGYATDRQGKVHLFFGADGDWSPQLEDTDADVTFVGDQNVDRVGSSLSHGDVNGDGFDDIVIGAEYYGFDLGFPDHLYGAVYVVFGGPDGWTGDLTSANLFWLGETLNYSRLGYAVAADGDLDGDGFDDLLLGATHYTDGPCDWGGRVYMIMGRDSAWPTTITDADHIFDGEFPEDNLGRNVAMAGDLDSDGLDDAVFGAADGGSGVIYVLLGRESGWPSSLANANYRLRGDALSQAGLGLTTAGDVNADGQADLLVGGPYAAGYQGVAWGLLSLP